MNAIRLQQLSNAFVRRHIPFLPGIIARYIHFRYNCDISPFTQIGGGVKLGHGGIGVVINQRSIIGQNCIIAQNVTIAAKDGSAPIIDDWSYIGANSVVLGGVHIGQNAFVGALSLVNKDVPDGAIVAGIPAKVIRIKNEEEIQQWHKWVMSQGGIHIDEQ